MLITLFDSVTQIATCNQVLNECNNTYGDFTRLKPSTPKSTVKLNSLS